MLSRRGLLTSTLGTAAITVFGCTKRHGVGLKSKVSVRHLPAPITYHSLRKKVASESELKKLLSYVVPDARWAKYPPSYIYHALRLWGKESAFTSLPFRNSRIQDLGWGAAAFGSLVDDSTFLEVSSAFGDPLLVPSEFGLAVATTSDPAWGQEFASTHPGKFEQVMADLAVNSKHKLVVRAGGEFTLEDVIDDSSRRIHKDVECEWSTVGLGRYLETDRWQNRFGQWIDFDHLAQFLLSRRFGEGACHGTHVPFALATLNQLVENGYRKLMPSTLDAVRTRLARTVQMLSSRIGSDGAWSEDWAREPRADTKSIFHVWGRDFPKIVATGHHLEWMSMCDDHARTRESLLESAIVYLLENIPQFAAAMKNDWFVFLPLSHAVRAICKLHGVDSPDEPT